MCSVCSEDPKVQSAWQALQGGTIPADQLLHRRLQQALDSSQLDANQQVLWQLLLLLLLCKAC